MAIGLELLGHRHAVETLHRLLDPETIGPWQKEVHQIKLYSLVRRGSCSRQPKQDVLRNGRSGLGIHPIANATEGAPQPNRKDPKHQGTHQCERY